MITVPVGGKGLVIARSCLLDYVQKCDFIKPRRMRPGSPQGDPIVHSERVPELRRSGDGCIVTRTLRSSSVEEEPQFDTSMRVLLHALASDRTRGSRKPKNRSSPAQEGCCRRLRWEARKRASTRQGSLEDATDEEKRRQSRPSMACRRNGDKNRPPAPHRHRRRGQSAAMELHRRCPRRQRGVELKNLPV